MKNWSICECGGEVSFERVEVTGSTDPFSGTQPEWKDLYRFSHITADGIAVLRFVPEEILTNAPFDLIVGEEIRSAHIRAEEYREDSRK